MSRRTNAKGVSTSPAVAKPSNVVVDEDTIQRRLNNLLVMLTGHQETLWRNEQSGDVLTMAVCYWSRWPWMMGVIDQKIITPCELELRPDVANRALNELAHTHYAATKWIIRKGKSIEMDVSAIYEESRVCREMIFAGQYPHGPNATLNEYWPHCLGDNRYLLPTAVQNALTDGGVAFERFLTAIELDPLLLGLNAQLESDLAKAIENFPRRKTLKRNIQFAVWKRDNGLTPAGIRDKWNALSEDQRRAIAPAGHKKIEGGNRGADVVKKAIDSAEEFLKKNGDSEKI